MTNLFTPLVNMRIPFSWEEMGPLLSQEEYMERLINCRLDHNKFQYMWQALFGRVVFDKLAEEFELLFDFKIACAKVPNISYANNMELRVLAHEMVVVALPNPESWRAIQQFGATKYKLQP